VEQLDAAMGQFKCPAEPAGMAIAEPTDAEGWKQLGIQQAKRGELDAAIASHQKALKLHEAAGNKKGMADEYSFLGLVYKDRGDLARAVEVLVKAEKLVEGAGKKELMATVYISLGVASKMKGDLAIACPALRKARALYAELGEPQRVEEIADLARRAECPAE
jgi:protein O-GlcNAc transferase